MSRLFLDSNVLIDGLVSKWGASRSVLSLCCVKIHRLVLAQYVIHEVEENLLIIAESLQQREADVLLKDYDYFIKLAHPEILLMPSEFESKAASRIIRHLHDAPVLASAIKASPDWLLSLNEKHFNQQVAKRTGLRIATPLSFFAIIHSNFQA